MLDFYGRNRGQAVSFLGGIANLSMKKKIIKGGFYYDVIRNTNGVHET